MPSQALLAQEVVLPDGWSEQEPTQWDMLQVRNMLLRMLQIKDEADQVRRLKADVAASYDAHLAKLDAQLQDLRTAVQGWLVHVNGGQKVVVPDIGTAYLQNKDAKPKAKLASPEAAISSPQAQDPVYWQTVFDQARYLQAAREAFETAGELWPGIEADKPAVTVALRPV